MMFDLSVVRFRRRCTLCDGHAQRQIKLGRVRLHLCLACEEAVGKTLLEDFRRELHAIAGEPLTDAVDAMRSVHVTRTGMQVIGGHVQTIRA